MTKFFTPQVFGCKVSVELADKKNCFNLYKWQPFSIIYKERFVLKGLYLKKKNSQQTEDGIILLISGCTYSNKIAFNQRKNNGNVYQMFVIT